MCSPAATAPAAQREIARALSDKAGQPVPLAVVRVALEQLRAAELLLTPPRRNVDAARRRVVSQLALSAGLGVALPAVWSIVAPTRAEAASATMCVTATVCTAGSMQCCGSPGSPAMSCSGNGGCNGNSSACMGLICN